MSTMLDNDVIVSSIVDISSESEMAINDAISKGRRVKSITVEMEATHSGYINGNNWMYTPHALSNAASSFVSPYLKPVTLNHIQDSKTLGRVTESSYVHYDNVPKVLTSKTTKRGIDTIKDYVKSNAYGGPGFKGLGHIKLRAKITDGETIDKILKYKVASVSVGGAAKVAYCSICKNNPASNSCTHTRGAIYNNEKCFYIGDSIEFNHISYVQVPADKHARSTLIQDAEGQNSHLSILDFEITDKDNTMSIDIKDFDKSNEHLVAHAKDLGLSDFQLPDTSNYTILDYVFSDEESFPIGDKLSALVAYDFVKNKISDSEDKNGILKVITDKFEELGVEDADKELKDAIEAAQASNASGDEAGQKVADSQVSFSKEELVELIKDALAEALKDKEPQGSKYLEQRNKVLADSIKSLSSEVAALNTELKDALVQQILDLEGSVSDDRANKLKERTIQSLRDHLSDLTESQKTTQVKDSQEDEKTIEPDSVSIEDAAENPENKENENKEDEKSQDSSKVEDSIKISDMSEEDFKALHGKVLKEQGVVAALALSRKRNSEKTSSGEK